MRALLAVALLATSATAQTPSANSEAVNARLRAAESSLEKQDYKAAEASLKVLATEKPKDAHILYDLGFAQERNNEEDEARVSYAAAVAADAKYADAGLALGLLDARKGRMDDAHRELTAVTTIADGAPGLRARAFRALAAMDSVDQPAKASDEILQAIKLTGETPSDTLMAADVALRSGAYADAERELLKVLADEPDSEQARVALGVALRSQGKLADAEAVLQKGLDDHPGDVPLTTTLADVYMRDNKPAQAIPLLETLRAKDPAVKSNVLVTGMLARMYSMTGRNSEAEPLAREAAALHAQDPRALDDLGSILVKEAKYGEAERVLATAVTMRSAFHDDTAWADAAFHLAFAASRNKDPKVTLQALALRATVVPNSPASLFLEATAHDALHQKKEAERTYKAFLALSTGSLPNEEFEARHRLVALQNEK